MQQLNTIFPQQYALFSLTLILPPIGIGFGVSLFPMALAAIRLSIIDRGKNTTIRTCINFRPTYSNSGIRAWIVCF